MGPFLFFLPFPLGALSFPPFLPAASPGFQNSLSGLPSAWRLDMQISAPVLHEGLTLGRAATQDGCVVAAFNHRKQPKP